MAAFEASFLSYFPACVSTYIKPMDGIEKSWQSIQLILAAHFQEGKERTFLLAFLDVSVSVLGTEPKTVCVFFSYCVYCPLVAQT